jgi:hypothetical protein
LRIARESALDDVSELDPLVLDPDESLGEGVGVVEPVTVMAGVVTEALVEAFVNVALTVPAFLPVMTPVVELIEATLLSLTDHEPADEATDVIVYDFAFQLVRLSEAEQLAVAEAVTVEPAFTLVEETDAD